MWYAFAGTNAPKQASSIFRREYVVQVQIRHNPSFAVARCLLAPGEPLRVESGAMAAMSADTQVQASAQGGVMKSLGRSLLAGESLFITTYTGGPQGGWVDVAANLPGDLIQLPVTPNQAWNVTRGSWLASEWNVQTDTKWGGFKSMFGGEGGFMTRVTGHGTALVSCYGALDVHRLAPGERLVLDTGHLVAFAEGMQFQTRRIGSTMTSLKSGEGLVLDFVGPGEVLGQSRNPSGLISWLSSNLPGSRS